MRGSNGPFTASFLEEVRTTGSFKGRKLNTAQKRLPTGPSGHEAFELSKAQLLTGLLLNLESRFPKVELLEALKIFDPRSYPSEHSEVLSWGNEELQTLIDHFGVEKKNKAGKEFPPVVDGFHLMSVQEQIYISRSLCNLVLTSIKMSSSPVEQNSDDSGKPRGFGKLHFVKRGGENHPDSNGFYTTHASSCQFSYPMKLILPMYASSSNCQWVYPVNYGGGLVAGDEVDLQITVDEGCCVMLASQSSTKVYTSDDGSNFYLTSDANLILMDWLTAGRIARGERWDFKLLNTTNCIYVDNILYFRDSICLTDSPNLPIFQNLGDYNIVASCVLLGKDLETVSTNIYNVLSMCRSQGAHVGDETLVSVSKLLEPPPSSVQRIPGIVIRMASSSISKVYAEISNLLSPLFERLGGNPFEGKF
ncbi:Urease accessory protein D [Holothuria leucospilota]|uniref:Urease accessory protein D n=1 Tax=Holothuria leucospilota TaxID=206669 RepID=A0A9Q0YKY4_HOLLE|nr:Urease accessory protein D [Holothuria leucospilota]